MNKALEPKTSAWRSPWVIAWVALVLVVLTANVTMIVLAVKTNPGLVVNDFYERGQHYERNLFSKMSRDPGWLMRIDVPDDLVVGQARSVRFVVVDRAGAPVDAEDVTFYAYRPSDSAYDFRQPMEREATGRYRADIHFPLIGVWDLVVGVNEGEEELNVGQRVSVARP